MRQGERKKKTESQSLQHGDIVTAVAKLALP